MLGSRSTNARRAACLLGLAVALAAPTQALAGADVPLKGSDVGGFTVTPGGVCDPGWFQVDIVGSGTATHVGKYAYQAVECFDGARHYEGEFTLTAANGDTIVGTYRGEVVSIVGSLGFYEHDAKIEGGTGRFAGASGSFHVSGIANLDPAAFTYTQELGGAVSSPGSAKT